jgi:hypothetical protein
VPCKVVSGTVCVNDYGEASWYRADVLYSYQLDGVEYYSNQIRHSEFSATLWSATKRQLVDRVMNERPRVCYVNPSDPAQAVLLPGLSPSLAWMLLGLVPLALRKPMRSHWVGAWVIPVCLLLLFLWFLPTYLRSRELQQTTSGDTIALLLLGGGALLWSYLLVGKRA